MQTVLAKGQRGVWAILRLASLVHPASFVVDI
jgi:hypothetical protein